MHNIPPCSLAVLLLVRMFPYVAQGTSTLHDRYILKPYNKPSHPQKVQSEVVVLPEVKRWLSQPKKNLIGGKWVEAASGKTFAVINPATEGVIAQVAEGGVEDVDRAVLAARKAFDDPNSPWMKMTPSERGRVVYKFADLLEVCTDLSSRVYKWFRNTPMSLHSWNRWITVSLTPSPEPRT